MHRVTQRAFVPQLFQLEITTYIQHIQDLDVTNIVEKLTDCLVS